jgi:cellulose synthase/poly-beta-1,6-N-acetylglucosamine synthase-like glycosyltransferase
MLKTVVVTKERKCLQVSLKQLFTANLKRFSVSIQRVLYPAHYAEFSSSYARKHGTGFHYKGKRYITHNTLDRKYSAVERTTLTQRIVLWMVILTIILLSITRGSLVLVILVSLLTLLYFVDLLFNLFLVSRSFKFNSEIKIDDSMLTKRRNWPTYTVLCPLYKEVPILPQFIKAMKEIEYPKNKLEVLILLEEDDVDSISSISKMKLSKIFKVVIVPHSMPKTKPKACNYGLKIATGEYSVIYDAEDIPDKLQLKKAVVAFEIIGDTYGCIQAKLNYYNWDQNILTRLFTLEYSLWFNLILTGLQSIKAPIPLGGTSNHFRTIVLRELGGWDPFNVTEDADLGIRLAKRGLKTAILDSTTLEEANSEFTNWMKQRSRWIKGYIQTYLVHMRDLREFGKNSKKIDMITFQLVIGGKIVSMLINPILWTLTVSYFAFRPIIGSYIQSLYITPVFYIGAVSLVLGNFLYMYYYMMGAAREQRPQLIIFAFFIPIYWMMMSAAAVYALRDLIFRPFHWHKTKHGLHLNKQAVQSL